MTDSDYSELESNEDEGSSYHPSMDESYDDEMSEDEFIGIDGMYLKKSVFFDEMQVYHNSQSYAHGNDSEGEDNLKRMEEGKAPIGEDGKPMNLHHADQTEDGPLVELPATYHQKHYSELHRNMGQEPSQIDRGQFNNSRKRYWKCRAKVYREENRDKTEEDNE